MLIKNNITEVVVKMGLTVQQNLRDLRHAWNEKLDSHVIYI
jgi:hypothetical protein